MWETYRSKREWNNLKHSAWLLLEQIRAQAGEAFLHRCPECGQIGGSGVWMRCFHTNECSRKGLVMAKTVKIYQAEGEYVSAFFYKREDAVEVGRGLGEWGSDFCIHERTVFSSVDEWYESQSPDSHDRKVFEEFHPEYRLRGLKAQVAALTEEIRQMEEDDYA